ncbi:DUF429 domain-containing protein [bacterium]|nr:DUF429 domain-containing protein [bacterium]
MKKEEKIFIGIDLGGRHKNTTGVCILKEKNGKINFLKEYCNNCRDIRGENIFKIIDPFLKETKVVAIDAPLTQGKGKGKMRLYEKFLSTKVFRQGKVSPLPPALMLSLCRFARDVVNNFEKRGFVLDINLIETFPTFVQKTLRKDFILSLLKEKTLCKSENQRSALICAIVAYLHLHFQTRYLGYKDGFLFLPAMRFWKKQWRQKFLKAWKEKPYLKYRYLVTNLFEY